MMGEIVACALFVMFVITLKAFKIMNEIIACVLFVMFVTTLLTKRKMVIFVLWCAICFVPFCLAIYDNIRDRTGYSDESAIWICRYILVGSLLWTLPILLFFISIVVGYIIFW